MEVAIFIVLILVFLFWKLFSVNIKGAIGEKRIASLLYFLDKSNYKVINNIVLEVDGKTTQIDHIVISDFGVFVIETKNYKGWILGGENSEYWTQVIFKRKERFYNPIRQNLGHIKALKICLNEFPDLKYISIIVFPSKAEIKTQTNTDVVYSSQLIKTIKKYTDVNLLENQKEAISQRINECNLIDIYDKRSHVRSIKQRIQNREEAIKENKCPQCGANLVKRNGKFGNFLGCTSYPRCKFTSKI